MEANNEKFLEVIAEKNNLTLKEAVLHLDYCLKMASINLGKEQSVVIKDFYKFLNPIGASSCKLLNPDECASSLYCTNYNDICIPIYVKDYEEINKDPDLYIQSLNIDQLKNLRDVAAHLYYNIGDSGIDDNSFDAIEYHLRKRLAKHHKKTENIGAIPIKKLRAQLPLPMPSLDKVKPGEKNYIDFIRKAPFEGIVWSDKLDGVSGLIIYDNGKPIKMYTRGDGLIGADVSYLIEYIDFPTIQKQGSMYIRGEFVIKRTTFRNKYKDIYSNPRSFVVAQINKGFINQSITDVDFVAYEIMRDNVNPIKDFGMLELLGFKTVEHGLFSKILLVDITITYKERREESIYDIDGLVLDYNFSRSAKTTLSNPEYKVAYKMQFEEQIRETSVVDVEWNISRYGRYVPVSVYKPVYINNVRMTRATGHNAAHIRDWNMGRGTRIMVVRSGDVIPQIKDVKVDENIDPIFPSLEYGWHWENKDIILNDIEDNDIVHQKRIIHFFSVIGVKGVGEKTIEKMYDWGLDNIKKIIHATPQQLIKIKGIGKGKSVSIQNNISEAMSRTPIDRFIDALTGVGGKFSISRKLVKQVLRTFPDLFDTDRTSSEIMKILKTKKIKGIGSKRLEMIATSFPIFRDILLDLDTEGVENAIQYQKQVEQEIKRKGYNPKIEGNTFVFTGFGTTTPYELEDWIFNNMGDFSSTVTSKTTAIISGTYTMITPKILRARELNIPIYTSDEFKDYVNT